MKIICDTNIWYKIECGEFKKEAWEPNSLVATNLNLFELSLTPRLIDQTEYVSKIVRTLHDEHSLIIDMSPMDYIIKKQYPDRSSQDKQFGEMLEGFEKLMSVDFEKVDDDLLSAEQQKFRPHIESWRKSLDKISEDVNNLLPEVRANIKKTTNKRTHRAVNSLPIFADILNLMVQSYTEGKLQLDIETYPWSEIELFVRVWDNYFKDLELTPGQKFHPNDWFDLFNLVYVDPQAKYWTHEKKWIEIISRDQSTKHYLFIPN
ncbi:MAG: hypothetical protein DCO96_15845 [Fluviicola sp. XM-24bin1]|nr:MAG: hypothetical protein DCO96_15845 [Fluviicola sp. XM-24bin1]